MIQRILIAMALMLAPGAARAAWYEARSTNFIVYSEGSEQDARDFAAKLERFHYVLRTFHRIEQSANPNKLRVFLLSSASAVGRMAGASGVAGFYNPGARGLMLVGTRSRGSRGSGDPRSARSEVSLDPESILLHEYTHHFMYQYFPATYPTWYSEGFAEFWGATRFLDNDVVEIGLPAEHRFSTFRALGWLPLDRLLRAQSYADVRGFNIFLLYAEGWLLTRYAFQHPERQRQLQQYLRLINAGTPYADAARTAFPDLDRFNSELFEYAGTGRFEVIRLPFRTIQVGEIATRALRPAENALVDEEIKLSRGIPRREAAAFAGEVRSTAARYPDDPFALALLAEAEWLAGNDQAAAAAADRALAIEANHPRALVIKARVQLAALRTAGTREAAPWNEARTLLTRARRAAPSDPVVLEAYYDSYREPGRTAAGRGAERALQRDGSGAERRRAALQARPRFRAARPDPRGDRDHPPRSLRHSAPGERIGRRAAAARGARGSLSRGPHQRATRPRARCWPGWKRAATAARRRSRSTGAAEQLGPASLREQLRLALQPIGIAAERAVGADHAVAGDQHRDIVVAIGRARRAHRRRAARTAAAICA